MRQCLILVYIIISPIIFASNTIQTGDSLLHVLQSTDSPERRIKIYRDLADLYLDGTEAKTYLLRMYNEASKIKDKKSMIGALNDIIIEEANTNNQDSLTKYIRCLRQVASPDEIKHLLPLYNMRFFDAQCFSVEKDKAIEKKLDLFENKKGTDNIYKEIASNYIMGVSFNINEKFKEALPYLDKAIKLTESIPSKNIRYKYWKCIIWKSCFTYAQAGKEIEAIKIMERLIELTEQDYRNNYQKQRPFYKIDLYRLQYYSFMMGSLSFLTVDQENYYWGEIQRIGKNLTNILDKYNYYLCANNYYSKSHTKIDLPKAITANDSLIKFATMIAPQNLPALYAINSQLYEKQKDYPNALKYLKISHHMQDSLSTEHAQKQLNELQVKYDVNTLNNEKAKLEIYNKRVLIISLSILLIIVIGVCTHLFFSLKKEKRMKAKMNALKLKAQESEKMKQAFINSICHEIRTPLNSIVGFSDLIMNPDIDEEMRREFPAEIQKNTMLLTSLVNSMLEVASLDVSEEKLTCEPADIRNICILQMGELVKKPGVEYKLDITEEAMLIPTHVQYLTLVIEHLLSNANKFTETGEIVLGYKANASKDRIYISVSDTGCGIPEEKREEVFNRFFKLNTFVPGNGLGLYLCRLIVKRLGGEIKIDPNYTKGTRMIVELPIM